MTQNNIQAYYKTNVCKLSRQEVVALKMQYLVALQMANSSCREMRQIVRGRAKEKLGIEIKHRQAKLDAIGLEASKHAGARGVKVWQESEERIEMRSELVKQFAEMLAGFNDDEETIDFFSDKLDLLKLEAQNKSHGKRK